MLDCPQVVISAQGQVFQLKKCGDPQKGGGRRGRVLGYSADSRKRLMEKMGRIDRDKLPLFVTVTYPAEFPCPRRAKRDFVAFRKRLMRRFPRLSLIWRMELQKRGAPHFHFLVWGVALLPIADVRALWAAVIGYEGEVKLQVKVERIRSWRGLLSYVSKYIAKVDDKGEAGQAGGVPAGVPGGPADPDEVSPEALLDYTTYLSAGVAGDDSSLGRVWGVVNEKELPLAELQVFVATWGRWFHRVKRLCRHVWPKVNGLPWAGCTLFRDDPYKWFDVAGQLWAECPV